MQGQQKERKDTQCRGRFNGADLVIVHVPPAQNSSHVITNKWTGTPQNEVTGEAATSPKLCAVAITFHSSEESLLHLPQPRTRI